MEFDYEIWKYDYGQYKVYVDKKSVINRLKKILESDVAVTYYKKGKEYAWDIIVPTKHLSTVKREIKTLKNRYKDIK